MIVLKLVVKIKFRFKMKEDILRIDLKHHCSTMLAFNQRGSEPHLPKILHVAAEKLCSDSYWSKSMLITSRVDWNDSGAT